MGTGGIHTTENIPETTEILRCPTENISDKRFLKHLILLYSLKIKLNTRVKMIEILFKYILKQSVNQNVRYICKIICRF
jgi:hypothetical protein